MAIFVLVLGCLGFHVAVGAHPANTVAGVGDAEVTLECEYGATAGRTWSKAADTLATADALENGIDSSKYEVDTQDPVYTLTIKTVDNNDGAVYICSDGSAPKSARLVTIATPTCTLADEGTDEVKMTCSASYGGDWTPLATLKGNDDTDIGDAPAGTVADGTVTREEKITVTSDNDGDEFKCEMGLHASNHPDKTDDDTAQNDPGTDDDKYKCSVTAAKPSGVTITSGGEHVELVEDDILTCAVSTAGLPTATMKWTDPDDDQLGTGTTYTVAAAMVGKAVTCSVRNNIGSSLATFPAPESSGRMTRAVVGELGLSMMTALLCAYM